MKNTPNDLLRFPSGATVRQVRKDAKVLQKQNPGLSYVEALERVSKEKHLAFGGYKNGLRKAREFAEYEARRGSVNRQYCVKCERFATVMSDLIIVGPIPYCGYHDNPYLDESEIPPYKGQIPEGALCFGDGDGCYVKPTRILGGACFCEGHYQDAASGARSRRRFSG